MARTAISVRKLKEVSPEKKSKKSGIVKKRSPKKSPVKKTKKTPKKGSDRDVYLKYIGYYLKNVDIETPRSSWKSLLKKRIGVYSSSTDKDVKSLALSLYFASFAALASCSDSWEIINKIKSYKKIKEFLQEIEKTRKKYGVPEIPVVYHTSTKDVTKHMLSMQGQTSTIKDIMSPKKTKVSPVKTKKTSKKTSPAKPKKTKVSPAKPKKTKVSPVKPKKSKASPAKKASIRTKLVDELKSVNTKILRDVNASRVYLVNYTDKSVAVYGDTKPIKEELKALGGKYNKNLTGGPGWIFPKNKEKSVQRYINIAMATDWY